MTLTPDELVLVEAGPVRLTATILFTWLVMAILVAVAWLVTRRLTTSPQLSRGQNLLEVLVGGMRDQVREVTQQDPDRYLPFVGTLFLFIAASNVLAVVPGFQPPTGSLSTTTALALCVFVSVPVFGIRERGVGAYLRSYVRPTPLMLPFNVIGELSRTLALAVRLFGNVMSGTLVAAMLLALVPFFLPVVMQVLGLLTGLVQAYIFAVLATVYIASATRAHQQLDQSAETARTGEPSHG